MTFDVADLLTAVTGDYANCRRLLVPRESHSNDVRKPVRAQRGEGSKVPFAEEVKGISVQLSRGVCHAVTVVEHTK